MPMNHVMRGTDVLDCAQALAPLGYCTITDDEVSWTNDVILNVGGDNDQSVQVVLQMDTYSGGFPPTQLTPLILDGGFYCIIPKDDVDTDLRDIANQKCLMVWDGDTGVIGYWAANATPQEQAAQYQPVPSGSLQPATGP